ncbi:hypothetical protein [Streptomyces ochraceiscleroticus]|uniref:TrbL/VirB6 plasmid conjugal transfer protein n=1 Tax=Streptomyces ochraceiscleroticus TaxID=47761 RepID=A0ABW1MBM1_9ACTN|nr:hypothetical protein [Streptomyces ochraceiscleroticus]
MVPRRAISWRLIKVGTAVRAGLFVLLALAAVLLATPAPANAMAFACDITGDDSYQMDTPGNNGEALMPAVKQWDRNAKPDEGSLTERVRGGTVSGSVEMPGPAANYTLYELNGMRGLNWSMTFKGKGDAAEDNGEWGSGADECSVMDYVNNGIADSIFNGTKILTRASISIKESASNPSPLAGLYEGRDNVVQTLKKNVLRPAVPVMIVLTGLWVFGKWRKGDMREVWSGVAWAGLTIVAVMAFLTGGNYDKVVSTADSGIAQANSLLTEAVLSGISGTMQPPCDLPKGVHNRGMRVSSCAMYDTLAFRPWALGQFGDAGKDCIIDDKTGCTAADPGETCDWGKGARCQDLRVRHAVAQSETNKDRGKDLNKFEDDWTPIRQEVAGGDHGDIFKDWSGQNAGNRVGMAFYSIVAALIVGLMVMVLSVLTLLWHAVTLILVVLLPLVATLGIHPSQQKLLKGWLETFIHSFVLRAGFGVILTVLLVLYQMILPAQIALGMQLLLLLLVTVAVVMMLKKLLSGNFSPKIAGAEDALGVGDMANAATSKFIDKSQSGAGSAGRVGGRVAAGAAGAATRFADRKLLGGKLEKGGWTNPTKRQQRQNAYEAAQANKQRVGQPGEQPQQQSPPQRPEAPATEQTGPKKSARPRLSSTGQQPAQPSAPQQQYQAPAQQPQPQPAPQPRQAPLPRQAPPQQPQPPQQPPQPPPPRSDGRIQQ